MKHKKHDKIVNDFENQKRKHLENLASKMIKKSEVNDKLKEKKLDKNIFDLF